MAGWIETPLRMEVRLGPGDFVLDRDPVPPKGGGAKSFFGLCLLWPNGWMDRAVTWHGGRPQPSQLCVRWEPVPLPQNGVIPPFSAHVYCGQTAAWIKMPLSTEVGHVRDHIVLDEDPAPLPKKGAEPPPQYFGPCLLWPNGWMDQDGTWHRGWP